MVVVGDTGVTREVYAFTWTAPVSESMALPRRDQIWIARRRVRSGLPG
jgi:hypothetical protein